MSQFAETCDNLKAMLIEYPESSEAVIETLCNVLEGLNWSDQAIRNVLDSYSGDWEETNEALERARARFQP